jgi:hypothetical protein
MALPFYDETVLPKIKIPISSSIGASERYLGATAQVSEVYVDISTHSSTTETVDALQSFWEVDCNFGLNEFDIMLPTFGHYTKYVAKFVGDLTDSKNGTVWDTTIKLKILGSYNSIYIIDDAGNYVVDDMGTHIVSDGIGDYVEYDRFITVNRGVIYGVSSPTPYTATAVPIYDRSEMPCIQEPFVRRRPPTIRYLGGNATTDNVYSDINILSATSVEAQLVYEFWKNKCNYGTEPFIINLPFYDSTENYDFLVMFTGGYKDVNNEFTWTSTVNIKVLGRIVYTIEPNGDFTLLGSGDFVLDENGNYVATGLSNLNKDITYGND